MPPADPRGPRLQRDAYHLTVRQHPKVGKASGPKEKVLDRKPVDPPPIVQLRIRDYSDPSQNYLQSPYFVCICNLWDPVEDRPARSDTQTGQLLTGTLVSSLHRLKDSDNTDGGFFVFGDLSVKPEGTFRLRFLLYEMLEGEIQMLQDVISDQFVVHNSKTFPGMAESTFLSRSFGDQGVRLRIRKETRSQLRKRQASSQQGDSQYQPKSRQDSMIGSMSNYSISPTYPPSADYHSDYSQSSAKRPRYGGAGPPNMYGDRNDAWQYSQPQHSPGVYSHSGGHGSGYGSDPLSAHSQMEYNYRPMGGEHQGAQPYDARGYMPQYQQPPPQNMPYDPNQGMGQYGEQQQYGNVPPQDPNSQFSPTSRTPVMRNDYPPPQGQQQNIRSQHRYSIPGNNNQQMGSLLPPIPTSSPQSQGNVMQTSPTQYSNMPPTSQAGGNMRPPYANYQSSS